MNNLKHLASRLFNTPQLITPAHASVIVGVLSERMNVSQITTVANGDVESLEASRLKDRAQIYAREGYVPYYVKDGVAVIRVEGSLTHKLDALNPSSGQTGYDGIEANLAVALEDPDVRGVLLDCNTPGGQAAGAFGCAEAIRRFGEEKPIWGLADEMACSGGYLLAAQCSRIVAPPLADVGSIGVVMVHYDFSRMLDEQGITATIIQTGDHKTDGSPFAPLPDDVRAAFEADQKLTYDAFVDAVARGRGLDEQAVRDTQARIYRASQAVEIGLVDELMLAQDVVKAFSDELGAQRRSTVTIPGVTMNDTEAQVATAEPSAEINAAEIRAEARATERERIGAILNSEEAAGREGLAKHFAFSTSMSADEAVSALKESPKPDNKAKGNDFREHVAAGDPDIQPAAETETDEVEAMAASIANAK